MKKIIIGISLVLLVIGLCGCKNSTTNDNVMEENQQVESNINSGLIENNKEVENEGKFSGDKKNANLSSGENNLIPNITENIVSEEISNNWEDGEFLYDGKKIKLICNFSELEKNLGLKFNAETKYDHVLNPNSTVSGGQCNVGNSEEIVINLLNSSDESKKYPQCDVDTFSINLFNLKKNNDTNYSKIQLAKGIGWESTADEIIAAYGEPHKKSENEYGFHLYYKASDSNSKLEFGFTNDLGLTSIYYTID